jgi:uncharacterized glyoxalase superfamily protein PhnB
VANSLFWKALQRHVPNVYRSHAQSEHGNPTTQWARLIFHVSDVDGFWAYFREKGLHLESPRDAPWGERYFHMCDPDGHELSFARPI